MDGLDAGKRGEIHYHRTGIALDTQNYKDAPNHAKFPKFSIESWRKLQAYLCI